MIDINVYRSRIGTYCQKSKVPKTRGTGNCIPNLNDQSSSSALWALSVVLYLYYILIIMFVTMSITLSIDTIPPVVTFPSLSNREFLYNYSINVKIMYIFLVWFLIKQICTRKDSKCHVRYVLFLERPTANLCTMSRLRRLVTGLCYWSFLVNFTLIAIVNPSLLNPGPGQSLSVVYHNVQGLIPFSQLDSDNPQLDTTKILELNSYISDNKPDLLILNETWLKKSISDSEILPTDDYKVFRHDRCPKTHPPDPNFPKKFRRNGGGVLICIRRDLDVISTKIGYKCEAEILGINLNFSDGKKLAVCTCYRVGTLGSQNHDNIKRYLSQIRTRRGTNNIVIVGDFNMRDTDWNTHHSPNSTEVLFLNTFSDLGFTQLIDSPTHIKGNLLDILVTNKPQIISDQIVNDNFLPCKSDHFPVSFCIKSNVRRKKAPKREIFNYKRANWNELNNELRFTNWNNLLSGNDVETAWRTFKTHLNASCTKHIPKIKIKSGFQPPWFDSETYDLCRRKERFRAKYKQNKSTESYVKFSNCRREFKHLCERKMRDNLFGDGEDSNYITKKFWSYVKSKSNSHRIPELIYLNDTFRADPADQAELFNTYFCDQFSDRSNYNIGINHDLDNVFNLNFNHSRVRNLLLKLNVNKAQGPDGIHAKILKNCAVNIAYPLYLIFKLSYSTSTIPMEWKMANVVPVHKKNTKANVANYRPISLTCIVMKVFEIIIRDDLMIRCNDKLDSRQHGFLPSKSCCTQLVGFCDSLSLSLNNNLRSDVIYFDFAKAFDSVNHDLILQKLKNEYRIDGLLLKFIRNYLKDRKQSVIINNCNSSTRDVLSGVPQGSILGPSLFLLFLNDMTQGLSPGTQVCMYADDTKIWRVIHGENDHIILQRDIDYLMDWALRNKMNFHPSKCKALMVSHTKPPLVDILPEIQFYYSMGNNIIDYYDSEKDLGIHINGTLNWTQHCDTVYSKANRMLGLLKRTCHFVNNSNMRRALYLSLVRSQFETCPIVWKPSSITAIIKLENIQKRSFKWILGDLHISYSSDLLYHIHCKQLNILPITFRFDLHDLKFFHSVVYNLSCVKLPQYLRLFNGTRLRSSHLDRKCYVSDVLPRNIQSNRNFSNSYFYRAHLAWNRLPLQIRDIETKTEFKTAVTKYLWNEISVGDRQNTDSDNDVM